MHLSSEKWGQNYFLWLCDVAKNNSDPILYSYLETALPTPLFNKLKTAQSYLLIVLTLCVMLYYRTNNGFRSRITTQT